MSRIFEAFRSTRKAEMLLLIALICVLLLLAFPKSEPAGDSEEAQMSRLLSRIEGAGGVRVMLSEDENGVCTGAVVLSAGADNMSVVLELERAVQTLTGLELNQIEVIRSAG